MVLVSRTSTGSSNSSFTIAMISIFVCVIGNVDHLITFLQQQGAQDGEGEAEAEPADGE